MIRNYNVLSGSRDTRLKNRSVIDVGICPTDATTSKTKKSSTSVGWLIAFLLMFGLGANAQVVYTQAFTANNGGWTGFSYFTGATACGGTGGAMRFNLYGSAPTANFVSPLLGVSDGSVRQLSFDYKVAVWSANTAGAPNPWGNFLVQWGATATGPWNTIGTVDSSNHVVSGSCVTRTYTFTPPNGSNVYLRYSAAWSAGDYYLNFDNISVQTPPIPCTGTPTAGTIPATSGICSGSSTSITVTGFTTGASGITFLWEESDDNGVGDPWGPAVGGTGATTATYTTPALATPIFYRARVTCTPSGLFANTNSTSVTVVSCTFNVAYTTATMTSIMPVNGGTGTVFSGWVNTSGDDNTSTTQPLAGTTFTYQGAAVSGFQACSNGWMTFNTANTSASFSNSLTSTTQNRILAPFFDDLVFTGQAFANRDTSMRYQVQGTLGSGSAVIVVEWAGIERFNIAGPNLNFQVRLYEAGNVIEYVYGRFEGFDGTVTSAYSYSIGYNGSNPAGTTPSDRFGMQTAVTNHFAASDPANHVVMPACSTKFVFTPGTYSGPTTAPVIPAPSNNESAAAQSVTVNTQPCISYCETYYTSRSATNSAFGVSTCGTVAGNEDDDVWFKFNTTAANDYLIRLRSSPGYDGVLQLLDSSFTSIACVNVTGTGLIETINATDLIQDGATYYIRVFHNGVGIGTSSGQFSLCVSQVISPPVNDNIGGAVSITQASSCTPTNSILPQTLSATASPQPVCGGIADDDVWYKFTVLNSAVTITVQSGSGYNAHVEVFSSSDNTATGVLTSLGCLNLTSTAGAEVYTGTALTVGQVLFVRVYHTLGGVGSGNFSICATFPPVPGCVTAPTAPANGSTTVDPCAATTLSWPSVSGATLYDVYFNAGATATTLVSANQVGLSYNVGILSGSTLYSWRIVPKNGTGPAVGCSDFTFTTAAVSPPACITSPISPLNASTICGGLTTFSWPASSGATYDVYIDNVLVSTAQTGTTYTQSMVAGSHTWSVIPTTCGGTATGCVNFTFSSTSPAAGDVFATAINLGVVTSSTSISGNNQSVNCFNNDYTTTSTPGSGLARATNDVFYKLEITCAGTLALGLCTNNFDTYLHLLDGTGSSIASNDDFCGLGSSISAAVTPGSYYVVVEGYSGEGTYTLDVTTTPTVACSSVVNLKLFIEGYYIGASTMASVKNNQDSVSPLNQVETITVELHDTAAPYGVLHTTTAMLTTNGTAVATFGTAPTGSFYISVSGTNAIKTWSKLPQTVGGTTSYDFSTAATQSYSDSMKNLGGGVFGFYSGDINQDGSIDGSDAPQLFDDVDNSAFGVQITDLNGDGSVDNSDVPLYLDNSDASVYSHDPNNP